jgi:glycosyltransferase involved in cell wall biosynthesis
MLMSKSILLLTNAYPDFPSSYHGIFIKRIALQLQSEGWKVSVVTPKIFRESEYFKEEKGVRVFRFPFFAGDRLLIEYSKIPYLRMILYYITGTFLTLYVVLRYQCRLIHAHWAIPTGPIGAVIGMLLRKPLFVTLHGSDLRMAMQSSFLKAIFLWVCRKAQHLTCVSEEMRNELENMGIDSSKIAVFPMGVDDIFFDIGGKRVRRKEKQSFTVLSNRNLQPIYNVSQLIRAIPSVLRAVPNAKFLIAGDGVERERLRKEVDRLGIATSVEFLGKIPHENMPSLLEKTDVYVSTSLSDGTSVSLLEAMASGAFPVVTDIAANKEWITDGMNGFLVPIDDETSLAQKIVQSLRNEELMERARQRNWEVVREKAYLRHHMDHLQTIYGTYFK